MFRDTLGIASLFVLLLVPVAVFADVRSVVADTSNAHHIITGKPARNPQALKLAGYGTAGAAISGGFSAGLFKLCKVCCRNINHDRHLYLSVPVLLTAAKCMPVCAGVTLMYTGIGGFGLGLYITGREPFVYRRVK